MEITPTHVVISLALAALCAIAIVALIRGLKTKQVDESPRDSWKNTGATLTFGLLMMGIGILIGCTPFCSMLASRYVWENLDPTTRPILPPKETDVEWDKSKIIFKTASQAGYVWVVQPEGRGPEVILTGKSEYDVPNNCKFIRVYFQREGTAKTSPMIVISTCK